MTKKYIPNKNSSLGELIRYSWKFHNVICWIFILSIILLSVVLSFSSKKSLSNLDYILKAFLVNTLLVRHLEILYILIAPALIITLICCEAYLMLKFDQSSLEEPLSPLSIKIVWFITVALGLLFVSWTPWKWISPILTIFTSILIPIALLNKKAPKTIIYKISGNTDKLKSKKIYKLSKETSEKSPKENKSMSSEETKTESETSLPDNNQLPQKDSLTHNIYYDELVKARELRNKKCLGFIGYWSLKRKILQKYSKDTLKD